MNPQMAGILAAQHNDELTAEAARQRAAAAIPAPRRRVVRWHVNWSRTTLAPAGAADRAERSWVIIISATTRSA
ncbi:MAG TPA: hypothetical protein VG142_02535 [Trebonia sp.]|nr:hypothetical protein [Trebonia sp.]